MLSQEQLKEKFDKGPRDKKMWRLVIEDEPIIDRKYYYLAFKDEDEKSFIQYTLKFLTKIQHTIVYNKSSKYGIFYHQEMIGEEHPDSLIMAFCFVTAFEEVLDKCHWPELIEIAEQHKYKIAYGEDDA